MTVNPNECIRELYPPPVSERYESRPRTAGRADEKGEESSAKLRLYISRLTLRFI